GLSRSYGNQALILVDKGQLDEAMILYQKEEAICEALGDRAGLGSTYWNQGILLGKLDNDREQKKLWVESIAIKQAIGIPSEKYEKALAALVERLKEGE
ncbi:MAG: hypothetical protein HRT35_08050, partial [Algicola sp.]|nr:hypothetical protein [Algicola sp.]